MHLLSHPLAPADCPGLRSEQTFLPRGQYDIVTKIEVSAPQLRARTRLGSQRARASRHSQRRLARITALPWENGEDMQILKCAPTGPCFTLPPPHGSLLRFQVRAGPEVRCAP